MPALEALFRWIHIVAGIFWIGHLYFFNFVNGPFGRTMDPDERHNVLPQLSITAVKERTAPYPAWAALAGARSRHNVYMSVPLVWTMISSHTTTPFASSPVYLLVVILVGWGAVYLLYKKAPKVPGF